MKNLIYSIAITCSFYCPAQNSCELKDENVIINKVIDIIAEKEALPKSVFIGEQVLFNLDRYLTNTEGKNKSDTLSLLMDGEWNYLKQAKSRSYTRNWKKISLSKTVDGKKISYQKTERKDIRFSTVQFSPERTKAFVIYSRTVKNISQSTVFFFFEKKNGNWIYKAHYIPFFD